jgi:hypothetical protein
MSCAYEPMSPGKYEEIQKHVLTLGSYMVEFSVCQGAIRQHNADARWDWRDVGSQIMPCHVVSLCYFRSGIMLADSESPLISPCLHPLRPSLI